MKSRVFLVLYRWIFPALILLSFVIVPWLAAPGRGFGRGLGGSFLEGTARLFVSLLLILLYQYVTYLDTVPARSATLKRAVWMRYGTFRGSDFILYYDPSSLPFFYFYNALLLCLLASILFEWGLRHSVAYSFPVSAGLAVVNFFLLFIPFVVQFKAFRAALFSVAHFPSSGE
jgi:hypothetical protein